MTFEWSAHAKHIQTLYAPWTPEDGYSEEALCATEARLGIAFPSMLRLFYRYWGKRKGLIDACDYILHLQKVRMWNGCLAFCAENQGVFYWGIRQEELHLANPPVWYGYDEDPFLGWELSHTQLSHFFDAIAYGHAFVPGVNHGAVSRNTITLEQRQLISQYWERSDIDSVHWRLQPSAYPRPHCWPIYIKPGQALNGDLTDLWVSVHIAEDLPQIAQLLGVEWEKTW